MRETSTRRTAGPGALSALLLLGDGRFPSGGHAHSGGLEAAVALEGVNDVPALEEFLRGRLATAGVVTAAFTAAACAAFHEHQPAEGIAPRLEELDWEMAARTPSPALRMISQRLGRQMLRAGRAIWPHAALDALGRALPRGPHQPTALGAVAAAAGLEPAAAALAAAQDAVTGPATAAVRLLALDPFAVHAALARLAPDIDVVGAEATTYAHRHPAELPATAGLLAEIGAEHHALWERRLFAS